MKDLDYIEKFHNQLNQAKIMLAYNGIISKEIVDAFIMRLKDDITAIDVPKKEKKRFFSIVVECIQNLSKHGNVSELNDARFMVLVEKENQILKISTGNVVNNESEKVIKNLVNNVNKKSGTELRALYIDGITRNKLSEKGEASLGLIDIARKSSQKLKYRFQRIDDQSSFFLFQTQIRVLN